MCFRGGASEHWETVSSGQSCNKLALFRVEVTFVSNGGG